MPPLLVWFLYANLVAACVAAAAWLGERVAALHGTPLRWGWTVGLALSAGLPVHQLLAGSQIVEIEPVSNLDAAVARGLIELTGGEVSYAASGEYLLAWSVDRWILGGWLVLSGAAVLYLLVRMIRLRGARSGWLLASDAHGDFFVTDDLGPGIVGVLRPSVVVPRWVLELPEDDRAMIRLHEEEHLAAGDSRLVGAALALVVLLPWILPLWWQAWRLRRATELDCDRRVLRRFASPRAYGELLLRVAGASNLVPVSPFGRTATDLERRLRSLKRDRDGLRGLRSAVAGSLAVGFLAVALAAPTPTRGDNWSLRPLPIGVLERTLDPSPDDYHVHPEVLNESEVEAALERLRPDDLRRAGIARRVRVLVHISAEGRVDQARIQGRLDHRGLRRAALEAATLLRFRAAERDGEPVDAWLLVPFEFDDD